MWTFLDPCRLLLLIFVLYFFFDLYDPITVDLLSIENEIFLTENNDKILENHRSALFSTLFKIKRIRLHLHLTLSPDT